MVDALGRLRPADSGDGAPPTTDERTTSSSGLRRDGALAGLDRAYHYSSRYRPLLSPPRDTRQGHLSSLLAPLASDPEALAERLLRKFGSLHAIVNADETDLRAVAAYGDTWLSAFLVVRRLLNDGFREEVVQSRLGENPAAMERYLRSTMGGLREERLLAIFADYGGYIISEEIVGEGGITGVSCSPRRIFSRALSLDARRIVIAHNHPSGSAEPSDADIKQTAELKKQAKSLDIEIEDHFIVGRKSITSMRRAGLL